MLKPAVLAAALVALVVTPAAATAADVTLAVDPVAQQVTALGATTVWVSGTAGAQRLMERTPDGRVAPVAAAPVAATYRSVDLGRSAAGPPVLTYVRCSTPSRCVALRDDLAGHRTGFRALTPARCRLSTAPAVWREWIAYGVACRTRDHRVDRRRTGLYVKRSGAAARRLALPHAGLRMPTVNVTRVDLHGTTVLALAGRILQYAFIHSVSGPEGDDFLVADSASGGRERAVGLALGAHGVVWSLADGTFPGFPNVATIGRYQQSGCIISNERLENPAGPDAEHGFRAIGLAVDGARLLLVVPGVGIVAHAFSPPDRC